MGRVVSKACFDQKFKSGMGEQVLFLFFYFSEVK